MRLMEDQDALRNNRIKNTARMALASVFFTLTISLVPFLIRSMMIKCMGDEYAGLNSLLVSIMSIINLSELGLSGTIEYFLYEPMAKGDTTKIEAYLNVFKHIYHVIAVVVFFIGILFVPFLHYFANGNVPDNCHLYFSFLIYLIATCFSYLIYPETDVLLLANQRGDIDRYLYLSSSILGYILEIMAITIFHSFLLYYMAIFIQSIFKGILRICIKKKYYSTINPCGRISVDEKKELRKRIFAVFGHQLNDRFISSVDYIVISTIMGLSAVALYGNYMYVVSAVFIMLSSCFSSVTAAMGNAFVTETIESNYLRFRAVLWLNGMITSWAMVCMLCLFQLFMNMWLRDRLLPMHTVILFCIYFYMIQIRQSLIAFKNANGMWWEDRFKPYISLVINLIIDIILVETMGINGALISSIVCIMIIEIPWEGKVLYCGYFNKGVQSYITNLIAYFIFASVVGAVCFLVCNRLFIDTSFLCFISRGIVCSVICIFMSLIIYRKSKEWEIWKESFAILIRK